MADVKRSAVTPTVAQAISRIAVANSTTDATSSFALWGGLEANAVDVVASTITGAVGQMYLLTANSGTPQTATVDFTLPSASVGERIGVYHVDGDPAYEIVLKGAASQSINGGADATEWSRLFIQGECVVFRCIAAGDWIVEYDGRIPCAFEVYLSTAIATTASGAWYTMDLANWTVEHDNGSLVAIASDEAVMRRAGRYSTTLSLRPLIDLSAADVIGANLELKTAAAVIMGNVLYASTSSKPIPSSTKTFDFAYGDDLQISWYCSVANKGWWNIQQFTFWTLSEVL